MLTHAFLPHGIAVTVELLVGANKLSGLCGDGPSCDPRKFPAKHGLHATRGEYTEVERVAVGGAAFKVETAAANGTLNVRRSLDYLMVLCGMGLLVGHSNYDAYSPTRTLALTQSITQIILHTPLLFLSCFIGGYYDTEATRHHPGGGQRHRRHNHPGGARTV